MEQELFSVIPWCRRVHSDAKGVIRAFRRTSRGPLILYMICLDYQDANKPETCSESELSKQNNNI